MKLVGAAELELMTIDEVTGSVLELSTMEEDELAMAEMILMLDSEDDGTKEDADSSDEDNDWLDDDCAEETVEETRPWQPGRVVTPVKNNGTARRPKRADVMVRM